jgi:multiple sugar transport system substrate-binding protein
LEINLILIRNLFLISLILLVQSCGSENNSDTDQLHEIRFWHSFVASSIPAINKMIAKYEEENPEIKIIAQYVPSGDPLVHKLITAIQSGTTPDISWIHSDFLEKLVEAKAVYPMDYFINGPDGFTEDEYADFFPQLMEGGTWNDSLYAIPMEATTLALLYNKSLLAKNGINPPLPPKNWNELNDYVNKLTIDKDNDGKFDQYGFYVPAFPASGPLSIWMLLQWEPFLWQAGGELINSEQTEILVNEKAAVSALKLWKDLYDRMRFGAFSLSHDMSFASGTVAMIMDGPWNLPLYRKIDEFEWGVAKLPEGPAKEATYLAGEYLTIFKTSKNPAESWKFIKWFTDPKIQAEFSIESGYMPVRKSTLELPEYKKYLQENEHMAGFIDQIEIARSKTKIDKNKVEINQVVSGVIENVLVGNTDPKTAIVNAKKIAERYLKNK